MFDLFPFCVVCLFFIVKSEKLCKNGSMIICVGEAVIDLFQTPVEGLGEAFLPLPGGCAYNASIAIGRLGIPVAFLGKK
jgi:hypothetical protein